MNKHLIFLSILAVCTLSNAMVRQSAMRALRPSGLNGAAALVMGKKVAVRRQTSSPVRLPSQNLSNRAMHNNELRKLLELSKEYRKLDSTIKNFELPTGYAPEIQHIGGACAVGYGITMFMMEPVMSMPTTIISGGLTASGTFLWAAGMLAVSTRTKRTKELETLKTKRQETLDAYTKETVNLARTHPHGEDRILKRAAALMNENELAASLAQKAMELELEQ